MKKLWIVILTVLLVVAFSSCNQPEAPNNTDTLQTENGGSAVDSGNNDMESTTNNNAKEDSTNNQTSVFLPDYSSGKANIIGNLSGGYGMRYTSQDGWIYFSPSNNKIYKFKTDISAIISVYEVATGTITNLNVIGDWIYFYVDGTTASNSYIAKVRTDGSNFEKILSSVTVGDMLVVNNTIFFTTIVNPYHEWAKDCAPLYFVSVDGGVTKQIHDGYVTNLTADSKHIYFLQTLASGESTIYRMKHDTTKKVALLKNVDTNFFILKGSKLYFMVYDKFGDCGPESTITSISTNGGSYTTYGKIPYSTEWMFVANNKVYYGGYPYYNLIDGAGIVEYNLSTKQYKIIKEIFDNIYCYGVSDLIIYEAYQNYKITSIFMYNLTSNTWSNISIK